MGRVQERLIALLDPLRVIAALWIEGADSLPQVPTVEYIVA
jgi:hypothetical protein